MRQERGGGNKNSDYLLWVSLLFNISNIQTPIFLYAGTAKFYLHITKMRKHDHDAL